jgi:hypothetical protein
MEEKEVFSGILSAHCTAAAARMHQTLIHSRGTRHAARESALEFILRKDN